MTIAKKSCDYLRLIVLKGNGTYRPQKKDRSSFDAITSKNNDLIGITNVLDVRKEILCKPEADLKTYHGARS